MRNVQLYLMTVSNANFLMRKLEWIKWQSKLDNSSYEQSTTCNAFRIKLAYCNARCDTFLQKWIL